MKNHKIYAAVFSATLMFTFSCSKDTDLYTDIMPDTMVKDEILKVTSSLNDLRLPENPSFTNLPSDPKNPLTQEKVDLGKFLFHETGLALNPKQSEGMNTYSCASCHHSKAGFQSGIKQGIGEGGSGFGLFGEARVMASVYDTTTIDIQPIRTPTILNTAYQDVMLWNGQFGATKTNAGTEAHWTADTPKAENFLGFEGLETQALAGLDVHRLKCDPEMVRNSPYKALFDAAYPDINEDERYTKLYAALAIAAYERTVLASEAPFQKWLRGNSNAMNANEKKGAVLFFGKGKCYSCHSGPGLNGMDFHALGMNDLGGSDIHGEVDEATKKGRGGFTKDPADDYTFKTPTLYNLKDVKFLGHGGSFSSVRQVIEYKNAAVRENNEVPQDKLSAEFSALGLSEVEIDQLTAFVENSLYDNNLIRYVPESLPTGQCFPVADAQSKEDMGCN